MTAIDEFRCTEENYNRLSRTCDNLMARPGAPDSIVMIPWLHIINEVPFVLEAYSDVVEGMSQNDEEIPQPANFVSVRNVSKKTLYHWAQFIKNFIRSFYFPDGWQSTEFNAARPLFPKLELNKVDVVIVTWLLNRNHLREKGDFYFGDIQEMLAKRGLSSLLLLRNQSGYHSHKLQKEATRKGPCARFLLPDTQNPMAELRYLKECITLRNYLRRESQQETQEFVKRILQKATELSVLAPCLHNFRLYDQLEIFCRRFSPSIILTLYEGHAWERCVWHAARRANPRTLCVGYQHVIMRKKSHAVRRSLHPYRAGYDPDLLLTLGGVTQGILESSNRLANVTKSIYGTHRRNGTRIKVEEPKTEPVFLVLPEGVESETIYLLNLAIECACLLPDVRFIFRMHPVLRFEDIKSKIKENPENFRNVDLSNQASIEEDFKRTGYILYRGSSTVMYAILQGLKPYYFEKPNEINFDPIFELDIWRERVRSSNDLVQKYHADQETPKALRYEQWLEAFDYCDRYISPIREKTLDQMIARSQTILKP